MSNMEIAQHLKTDGMKISPVDPNNTIGIGHHEAIQDVWGLLEGMLARNPDARCLPDVDAILLLLKRIITSLPFANRLEFKSEQLERRQAVTGLSDQAGARKRNLPRPAVIGA